MIPRRWTPWVLEPPEIQKYMVVERIKLSGPDYIYRSFGHKGEYTGQSGSTLFKKKIYEDIHGQKVKPQELELDCCVCCDATIS